VYDKENGWTGEGLEDGICLGYGNTTGSQGQAPVTGDDSVVFVDDAIIFPWQTVILVGVGIAVLVKLTMLPAEIFCVLRCHSKMQKTDTSGVTRKKKKRRRIRLKIPSSSDSSGSNDTDESKSFYSTDSSDSDTQESSNRPEYIFV